MNAGTVALCLGGETLLLHPERAVIWPRRRTVIVADTHFGKTSFLGRHGIAVPAGTDQADWRRLVSLVSAFEARRLIILGDFLHAPLLAGMPEEENLRRWAETLAAQAEIHVVAGNHDRLATRIAPMRWWDVDCVDGPFRFVHDARRERGTGDESMFTLSGHIHPVIRRRMLGKGSLRVPVFWQTDSGLILPSFGQFTGGFAITPGDADRLYAVGPGAVVPF